MQSIRNSFYQKTVAAGATTTGTAERVGRFNSISIVVYSTQAITVTGKGGPSEAMLRAMKTLAVAANTRTELFLAAVDSNFALELTNPGSSAATVDVTTQYSLSFKVDSDEIDTGVATSALQNEANTHLSVLTNDCEFSDGSTSSLKVALHSSNGEPVIFASETSVALTAQRLLGLTDGTGKTMMFAGVGGSGGTQRQLAVDSSDHLKVAVQSIALPPLASTSTLQGAGLPSALLNDSLKTAVVQSALPTGASTSQNQDALSLQITGLLTKIDDIELKVQSLLQKQTVSTTTVNAVLTVPSQGALTFSSAYASASRYGTLTFLVESATLDNQNYGVFLGACDMENGAYLQISEGKLDRDQPQEWDMSTDAKHTWLTFDTPVLMPFYKVGIVQVSGAAANFSIKASS